MLHRVIILLILSGIVASISAAAEDHTPHMKGPFASGPEVTRACLECHDAAAKEVMKTSHWTWSAPQTIAGREVDRGKKNTINNFCVSVNANWPRCTSCHIGYGYKDDHFDFTDASRVDCLVCHDTTGTYKKNPMGAGMPDDSVDLLAVAQSVGTPKKRNCGACHFFGGGGDAVKHGDLDSSQTDPARDDDVHLSSMDCQECHTAKNHDFQGSAMVVTPANLKPIGCDGCHDQRPHDDAELNRHLNRVACQTCHIPTFARKIPTKTSWDWSKAGENRAEIPKDEYGKPTYDKKKGSFTWGKNIVPTYRWYNGTASVYLLGDTMNPAEVTELSAPVGNRDDAKAKIFPFKVHEGTQLYDIKNKTFVTPHLFGKDGYWKHFDWNKAAASGMQASGLPYSGELGWAKTIMYWPINHMVVPEGKALSCTDCHGEGGRMDWKALGYDGDPRKL